MRATHRTDFSPDGISETANFHLLPTLKHPKRALSNMRLTEKVGNHKAFHTEHCCGSRKEGFPSVPTQLSSQLHLFIQQKQCI